MLKPSDVKLLDPCPLTATLKKSEQEVAAAWLTLAMRETGDEFRAIQANELVEVINRFAPVVDGQRKTLTGYYWLANPFLRPDFDGLIDGGYAEWSDPSLGRKSPMAFTKKGIAALEASRWIDRPEAVAS